jgi:tetraacyldisaccharide 4'-kinase
VTLLESIPPEILRLEEKSPQAWRTILFPAALAYGGVVRLRAALYSAGIFRKRRLGGTVISVGNLTVGGTGKTPMVLWLADRLCAEGKQPAILTRGYRGGAQADATGIPQADEVALLRERLSGRAQLGVGKDRYSTGKVLERHGAEWFILDDGFQHLALERDADIVLIDAADPFGGGRLLPAGRMREPRTALARSDIIVITRTEHAPGLEAMVRRFTTSPVFYAQAELAAVLRAPALQLALPLDRTNVKFFAFCGIGNPAAFFYDLRRWAFPVVGERHFPDHHRYSAQDVSVLDREAASVGAEALVCTEKDVFNLREALPTSLPVYVCRVQLVPFDAERFWSAILEAVRRRRAGRDTSATSLTGATR